MKNLQSHVREKKIESAASHDPATVNDHNTANAVAWRCVNFLNKSNLKEEEIKKEGYIIIRMNKIKYPK